MWQRPACQPAISKTLQKPLPEGKSWKHKWSLWSEASTGQLLHPVSVCVCVCDMAQCADLTDLLPSARRRAAGTWQH